MSKPPLTRSAKGRRSARSSDGSAWTSEQASETRRKIAINRFTYRGGYDGYEGRMILRPELGERPRSET
ncbi:hypothetical protein [Methylobacterium sp. Leaf118]|uniref:hypothetical protein n=1 Tax=Methylobacterium sp. Leaf118 TaxID=2876562 RepID=UPI001E64DB44|nr:hypothetical protein [Methylobacterium sp. Leaf118]